MKLQDFDYNLPKNLIAQEPARPRDHSRLLVIRRGATNSAHANEIRNRRGATNSAHANEIRNRRGAKTVELDINIFMILWIICMRAMF